MKITSAIIIVLGTLEIPYDFFLGHMDFIMISSWALWISDDVLLGPYGFPLICHSGKFLETVPELWAL